MADTFWKDFLEGTWEKKPAHLGRAIEPLISPSEIFQVAILAGDALTRGEDIRIRWCDDGKETKILPPGAESASCLPQRSDRDLAGYEARMASLPMFFYQMPRLHEMAASLLWPRLVRFTRNFYGHTGVPANIAWTDSYFGRYTATPFGVHLDGASNFTFGIAGHKTLYLWEPSFYEAHMAGVSPHDYERFIPRATKLTVGPGETIYWPSRYWHIAVPDGCFSVTANFAFYGEESQAAWIGRALQDLLLEIEAERLGPLVLGDPMTVPEVLARRAASVLEVSRAGELERRLLRQVAEHATRLGFQEAPPIARMRTTFEPGDRVVLTPDNALACAPDGRGGVIVAGNGRSVVRTDGERVTSMVRALEGRRAIVVEPETKSLIEDLHVWGVVERYWA